MIISVTKLYLRVCSPTMILPEPCPEPDSFPHGPCEEPDSEPAASDPDYDICFEELTDHGLTDQAKRLGQARWKHIENTRRVRDTRWSRFDLIQLQSSSALQVASLEVLCSEDDLRDANQFCCALAHAHWGISSLRELLDRAPQARAILQQRLYTRGLLS